MLNCAKTQLKYIITTEIVNYKHTEEEKTGLKWRKTNTRVLKFGRVTQL